LDFGPRGLKPLETLTQSAQALPVAQVVTDVAEPQEPPTETPGEALTRWYAEEAERAAAAEEALRAQGDEPDRLFLMMRAEQDERERLEEAAERRRAMGGE